MLGRSRFQVGPTMQGSVFKVDIVQEPVPLGVGVELTKLETEVATEGVGVVEFWKRLGSVPDRSWQVGPQVVPGFWVSDAQHWAQEVERSGRKRSANVGD
jgi:hypothetical protein